MPHFVKKCKCVVDGAEVKLIYFYILNVTLIWQTLQISVDWNKFDKVISIQNKNTFDVRASAARATARSFCGSTVGILFQVYDISHRAHRWHIFNNMFLLNGLQLKPIKIYATKMIIINLKNKIAWRTTITCTTTTEQVCGRIKWHALNVKWNISIESQHIARSVDHTDKLVNRDMR